MLLLLLLVFSSQLITAQYVFNDAFSSQFIQFSGNITGTTTWASEIGLTPGSEFDCKGLNTPQYPFAQVFVGKNAPWDPNPFFFELYHFASDNLASNCKYCATTDDIYNLHFTTSVYDRSTSVNIDLNKSKSRRLQIGSETGYRIEGGKESWMGDSTWNSVDVESTCKSYTWTDFSWDGSTPVSFSLSFTNTTASLSLITTMTDSKSQRGVSNLTLSFNGIRDDVPLDGKQEQFNLIQLNTSDATTPQFNFLNGSNIFFDNDDNSGEWNVAATPIITSTTSLTSSVTTSTNGAVGYWGDVQSIVVVISVTLTIYLLGI